MTKEVNRLELKKKYGDEQVFVVPYQVISQVNDKFTKEKNTKDVWNKYNSKGTFILRYEAEYNPSFQQIIPYFFIFNKDKDKVYIAERLKGDARLSHMLSLGFGGHINPCDGHIDIISNALNREMNEELNIVPLSDFEYCGTIRDISSETNDHFGLIFSIIADEVSIKETDTLEGKWMTIPELIENYHKFENWSKFIIDSFYEDISKEK